MQLYLTTCRDDKSLAPDNLTFMFDTVIKVHDDLINENFIRECFWKRDTSLFKARPIGSASTVIINSQVDNSADFLFEKSEGAGYYYLMAISFIELMKQDCIMFDCGSIEKAVLALQQEPWNFVSLKMEYTSPFDCQFYVTMLHTREVGIWAKQVGYRPWNLACGLPNPKPLNYPVDFC